MVEFVVEPQLNYRISSSTNWFV